MNHILNLPVNVAKKYECTIGQKVIVFRGEKITLSKITIKQADELAKSKSTILIEKSVIKKEEK